MTPRSLLLLLVFATSVHAQSLAPLKQVATAYIASPIEFEIDGIVEAAQQSTLSAQIAGRVEQINFDVGDSVKKGSVILRIRDKEYLAQLEQSKANLAEVQAGLKDAQQEFTRVEGLIKSKAIPRSTYDKAGANLQALKARLASSKAGVKQAQERYNNTVVRAPYGGVVLKRHIELGESIQPGQQIMSGYAPDQLRVKAMVPQSMIEAVRTHNSARVISSNQSASIKIDNMAIFPYADPESHSIQLRLKLSAGHTSIFPGMLVKVAFIIDQTKRLVVPSQAIVYRSEVMGIYVIDQQHNVSFRQLRLGHIIGDNIEVLAGLDANEMVALDPVRAGVYLKTQLESR